MPVVIICYRGTELTNASIWRDSMRVKYFKYPVEQFYKILVLAMTCEGRNSQELQYIEYIFKILGIFQIWVIISLDSADLALSQVISLVMN